MTDKEKRRRERVVHGWRYDPSVSQEERVGIRLYLRGETDKPPLRWVQIDKACS